MLVGPRACIQPEDSRFLGSRVSLAQAAMQLSPVSVFRQALCLTAVRFAQGGGVSSALRALRNVSVGQEAN